MSNSNAEITDGVIKLILSFLSDYHKYFGKIFVYDGVVSFISLNLNTMIQDYLEIARKETREIQSMVKIIKEEDE